MVKENKKAELLGVKIGKRISKLRDKKNVTQQEMASVLFVERVRVSQWEQGTRAIKAENIVEIANYFGVSTDYLLGLSETKSPNTDIQIVINTTGLTEEAVNKLTSMPNYSDIHDSFDYKVSEHIQAKTMRNRNIINLLLTNDRGQKALDALNTYYFATLKSNNLTPFTLEVNLPNRDKPWTDEPEINNEALRGALLEIAVHELKLILSDEIIYKKAQDRIKALQDKKGRPLTEKNKSKFGKKKQF